MDIAVAVFHQRPMSTTEAQSTKSFAEGFAVKLRETLCALHLRG
jgi:hypothetical protein